MIFPFMVWLLLLSEQELEQVSKLPLACCRHPRMRNSETRELDESGDPRNLPLGVHCGTDDCALPLSIVSQIAWPLGILHPALATWRVEFGELPHLVPVSTSKRGRLTVHDLTEEAMKQ